MDSGTIKLVGISGTNGSGKDTLGHLLAENFGYLFISMTDMLRDELTKRDLPLDREHMRTLSAEWRREHGLGVLIDKAVDVWKSQSKPYQGLVVASIRNPGEVDRVHELNGIVLWVDAAPEVRFNRIKANAATRGEARSVDDNKTFDQFLADEQVEMQHSGDEATLSMSDVKLKADSIIINDSLDKQDFLLAVEKILRPANFL